MTELYDDCNWVKQKRQKFTDLSKEKIAWQDENMLGKRYEKFEKWREGLDWGTKKQADDNCTGDLILP